MDSDLFWAPFFLLAAVRLFYLCHFDFTLIGGFIFRFEGSHKAELVQLHGLEVVKDELDSRERSVLVGLDGDTLSLTHKGGIEVRQLRAFFSSEAFGLLVVDTLSYVVDSFEPYLEIVEATVAVAVVVDGYTNHGDWSYHP